MTTENKVIVILGLDTAKKAHAARFDLAQAAAVRKAAALMGFTTGVPATEEAQKLCARLAAGKLFATGRGLVPLVKTALYEELTRALELEVPLDKPASPENVPVAPSEPSWSMLAVGSVVVAEESPDLGWWRATVTAVGRDGTKLTLRWLDAPKAPPR